MQQAEVTRYRNKWDAIETATPAKKNTILQVFQDTSMKFGHKGLTELADEAGLDVTKLKSGEFIVFINSAQNAFKIFAPNNVVAHHKVPDGAGRIDMRTIALLPRCFNGNAIDYNRAIKEVLENSLLKSKEQ